MTGDGYAAPRSVDEAVALLAKNPGARVLAGGHNLLVEPGRRALAGALLVDLGRIDALAGIRPQKDGRLEIGAMTTLAAIAASDAIRAAYPAFAEAARSMGDAQMRNRATLGGSLASSDPEAALPALALALDATIQVTGPRGARTVGAADAPPRMPLGSGEVITAVALPAPAPRSGVAYVSCANAATLHALCGIAASVTLAQDGTVSACRVAVTGATERPERLAGVEQALAGRAMSAEALAAAANAAGTGQAFRGDLFASADYRAHLARVLTGRALKQAIERAGQ